MLIFLPHQMMSRRHETRDLLLFFFYSNIKLLSCFSDFCPLKSVRVTNCGVSVALMDNTHYPLYWAAHY